MGAPATGLNLSTAMQDALIQVNSPEFRKAYIEGLGFIKEFGALTTEKFSAGGLVFRYDEDQPWDVMALGATTQRTTVPRAMNQPQYTSIEYKRAHFNDLLATITVDKESRTYIQEVAGNQDDLTRLAAKFMLNAARGMNHYVSMAMVLGRNNSMGTIISATSKADDTTAYGTYTGRYTSTWELGVDAVPAAFRKGMLLSVCVPPSGHGGTETTDVDNGCGDVYNYTVSDGQNTSDTAIRGHCPVKIIANPSPHKESGTGQYLTLSVAIYYDATSKSAVGTIMDNIAAAAGAVGTGCVVTPYAGKLAAADSTKTQGPNFGGQGLLHLLSRANIATAGGACSTALATRQGTTVSRTSGGNFDWWVPEFKDAAAASITFSMIEDLYITLGFYGGGEAKARLVLINPLTWATLRDLANGQTYYRIHEEPSALLKQRFGKHGVTLLSFQGIGAAEPVPIVPTWWWPLNKVGIVQPSDFIRMAPEEGMWETLMTGSIWHTLHDADGNLQLGSQAFFMQPFQMHMHLGFHNGIVIRTTP